MRRVKRFGVYQTAKVAAVLYFLVSLIFIIPVWLFSSMLGSMIPQESGFSGGFLLIVPFLYAIVGFITVAIACAVYNLIAKWTGGIEVEVESQERSVLV